ncbi:lysostaphin resistance A-like protein [Dokdonella sp.]|uniref:CPBP family intramembrane glutamic endopeptidase n=1 Tax=Dokdonella sp. TaxID=2291710 RepID=UPI003527C07C
MLWSLLLGGTLVLGAIMVFRQGLLPLIDVMFQPSPETLSAIRRAGILFTAIAGYWVYVRLHERRKADELRLKPVSILIGGASGAVLIGIPIAVLFAIGAYELILMRGASTALFGVAALIGIAATLEELVFRCVLFRIVERAWGTVIAIPIQAALFALQHLENVAQGGTIDAVLMIVSVTVLGAFWAGVFVFTRNLWATAANHAAWNFTILLSGVPLSGIEEWRTLAPLEIRYAGPDWLTGGMFGPESSVLVIAVATVATILLLTAARRRGKFIAQAARN